jgi:hypothetical protein
MLLTWYVPSYAADQELFDVYHLEIEGNIFGFQTGDFNDDGRDDIFLVYSPADDYSARYIALFIQKMPSGFSNRADYLIALPLTAAQIDAGDVNDDGRIDIVFIDFDGVGYFSFNPGSGLVGPRRLIRQNSVYSFPHFMGIIATPFLFDITGDTAPEIVLPSPRGYIIYERGDDGDYQILNQLSAPINCLSPDKQFRDFFHRPKTVGTLTVARICISCGIENCAVFFRIRPAISHSHPMCRVFSFPRILKGISATGCLILTTTTDPILRPRTLRAVLPVPKQK